MRTLRADVPLLPERMLRLPISAQGYPVPWFVSWRDGVPDFRVANGERLVRAVKERRCWVCGGGFGTQFVAFTIGPMCAVNRTSAEPPSHRECADYAARACPFLVRPAMKRGSMLQDDLPEHSVEPAGIYLRRNPGVTLVWVTREWRTVRCAADPRSGAAGGLLFSFGEPTETRWYAEGRPATRIEVLASIASGVPALREIAAAQDREEPGVHAVSALEAAVQRAMKYLPGIGLEEGEDDGDGECGGE